jgi:hypothetical protein
VRDIFELLESSKDAAAQSDAKCQRRARMIYVRFDAVRSIPGEVNSVFWFALVARLAQ